MNNNKQSTRAPDHSTRLTHATTKGVDAENPDFPRVTRVKDEPHQNAVKAADTVRKATGVERDHEASSSEPPSDPNAGDPNERTDMLNEIAHPGSHGGAGAPGRKPT